MRRSAKIMIIFAMLLIVFSSTISHAAISKPKNFRIVYKSEKGKELASFEWSVYAVQQIFLDKLNISTYIDSKGYEYNVSGYRLMTWSGTNYTGKASSDVSMDKNSLIAALRKAYDTLDPPYSLQATVVMKATGNQYSTNIPVHVIWLNQDGELVREVVEMIGRDGKYTDKPPKEYKIISVSAMMTDIWKIGSEITVDPKSPTVRYDKFAEEYKIVYRLQLTKEQEAEIMKQSAETDAEETTGAAPAGTTAAETIPAAETTAASESTSREAGNTPAYSMTDPAGSETASVPTQTDESFRTGAGKTTLIIGLVIGIAVIYLIVITIGTKNKKKTPRRKNKI